MAQMSSCCIQWLNRDPNPPYPYLVQLLGMSFGTSILEERKEPIGNRGCDRRDIPYCFLSPLSSLPLSLSTHSLLCFAFCAVHLVKKRRRETRQQCAHSQIFTLLLVQQQ